MTLLSLDKFGIFRAYDIRGKYPSEINERVVSEISQCLGQYFKRKAKSQKSKIKIVIGHDTRLSSPRLYGAAITELQSSSFKLQVIKAGLITTPMLYFLVNHFKADVGIIITASHNPKEYNGLKIVGKKATPLSGEEIYQIIQKSKQQ